MKYTNLKIAAFATIGFILVAVVCPQVVKPVTKETIAQHLAR